MKKLLIFFIFFCFSLLFTKSSFARSNVDYWYIKDFNIEIVVNPDSSLDVSENIIADCGSASGKHGIFRSIPLVYKTVDGDFQTPIENISVSDFFGRPLNYTREKQRDVLVLKIGDANVEVRGENEYLIKYKIQNAIRFENENFAELYWNILGNFWDLEIDNFEAKIIFPDGFNKDSSEMYYYSGSLGEKNDDSFSYEWLNDNTLFFKSNRIIPIGTGLTVSSTLPKDLVTPYIGSLKSGGDYVKKFFVLILFINIGLILFVFFVLYRLWLKYGKDPKGKKTIIAEFDIPDNLSPLEMSGIISSGGLNNDAITASILNLAVKGYLKIEALESQIKIFGLQYKFIRTDKKIAEDIYLGEKYLLEKIFYNGTEISFIDLKIYFPSYIKEVSRMVLDDLDSRGFIYKKSFNTQKYLIIFGFLLLFLSFFIFPLFSLPVCAVMMIVFGSLMSKRTEAGTELNWRIKCFKLYLNTAEKYRSQFNEKEGVMEKFLPYAILFKMTKKWLKKMKDIYSEEYSNNYNPSFLIGAAAASGLDGFISSIDSVTRSISNNISPSSSGSSGGGSSGGGGGGGGW